VAPVISEKFSENPTTPKRMRGRPRLFAGKPTRNEQNLCYARMAYEVLSQFPQGRFEWICKSRTLLTELGRIKDPKEMICIADAISCERRTWPNRKPWPTAQMLRRIVRQWRVGQESSGSQEELARELEALIQDYRERHPKLKKSEVTKALSYVLFIYKGTPWGNHRPDKIVRSRIDRDLDRLKSIPSGPAMQRRTKSFTGAGLPKRSLKTNSIDSEMKSKLAQMAQCKKSLRFG
jgi:hypothetical protein